MGKRKRYYQKAPRELGFELAQEEFGGVEQAVWLRAAARGEPARLLIKRATFLAILGLR